MVDINCDRRQKEISQEGEQFRCVEQKALDTYLKIVDVPTCESCPIMAANVERDKSCGQRHWSEDLLSVSVVNPRRVEEQYDKPCNYRRGGKCGVTGHAINPGICKACDQETADHLATLPEMGVGFALEVKRWIREGRPVRTDEEVLYILETFCKPCKLYDPVKCACKKCGCAMNDSSWPLLNGIKMKSKKCPLNLWD